MTEIFLVFSEYHFTTLYHNSQQAAVWFKIILYIFQLLKNWQILDLLEIFVAKICITKARYLLGGVLFL